MTGASMSQEIHHRNVYSLSEEFDRHEANQTQHKMQTLSSRRGKLRVRDFEPTTAESAVSVLAVAGVPIEIVEDRDAAAVYVSSCASNTISEMFNFSNTAELIDCHNPHGYHRLQQQLSPITSKWYAGDRLGMVQLNPGNITSLDEASGADSPTAIQLFFMNPQSASTASIVDGPQAQQCQRTFSASSLPPMGTLSDAVSTLHPHHPVYQSHAFLGTAYASIGDAAGLGVGHVIENQVLSLSLSSPLKQFELAKAEDQQRIRPEGLPFNVNSTHEQQEQHPNHHQPPHVPSHDRYGSHVIAGPNVHMSYSTMDTVNLLRTSKYAWAAQELLEEFCNLRTNKTGRNFPNPNPSHGGGAASTSTTVASSSSLKDFPHLSAADRFENQRKKSKLLSMLDEVDRRYNHYCEEMQMVVNSFDTVIGLGAAAPYTALAKKAMSRHFRCLKDAMAAQLKRTCELLGEKDAGIVSGLTKGDTPRLRLIDQSLRQQRAFQQTGMMDHDAWRPQRGLPDRSVNILRAWLFEHFLHPYPGDADKHLLARQAGLSRNQVTNWFINARVRLWKPMVEEMYIKEAKDEADLQGKDEETNSQMLVVAKTQLMQQQKQPQDAQQSPESDAPESDHSAAHISMSPVHHEQLRFLSPIEHRTRPPVITPGLHDVDIYRRVAVAHEGFSYAAAAAATASRAGDVSLTLGLQQAGGNDPENSRFGV